jgi:hypothetical protein
VGEDVLVWNGGTIAGGMADGGTGAQANAITFTGGNNTLFLEDGYNFIGNVDATASGDGGGSGDGDVLMLAGDDTSSTLTFELSQVGTQYDSSKVGTQYLGFESFGKIENSTWTLTGEATADMIWGVAGGTLLVNGNLQTGSFDINTSFVAVGGVGGCGCPNTPGGTLGGTGELNGLLVFDGGTLAPGAAGASTGTLTAYGVWMDVGATFAVQLGGTDAGDYDVLRVTNAVGIAGATLDLSLINGFLPSAGSSFTIINNEGSDAVIGTFAGLDEGAAIQLGGQTFPSAIMAATAMMSRSPQGRRRRTIRARRPCRPTGTTTSSCMRRALSPAFAATTRSSAAAATT